MLVADIYVCCSEREGFGLAVAQAMGGYNMPCLGSTGGWTP